jgi:hypothetical protein
MSTFSARIEVPSGNRLFITGHNIYDAPSVTFGGKEANIVRRTKGKNGRPDTLEVEFADSQTETKT